MSLDLATSHSVMVQVWVGKHFPDMRQNEREIKFIRMGDAVRIVGQLKGELPLSWACGQFYSLRTKKIPIERW